MPFTFGSRLAFFGALLSLILSPLLTVQASGQPPEGVIREFYAWYVKAVLANRDPFTDDSAKLKQNVTARFLGQIEKLRDAEELSFDPFLHAQDLDYGWAKNIRVSTPAIKSDKATATVELGSPGVGAHKLAVTLRQEAGAWKLDQVEGR